VADSWTGTDIGYPTIPTVQADSWTATDAVVLVGYRDGNLDDEDGGGRFIFRNSWGTLLPMKPEIQVGYFSVAYRYFTDPKTMPSYPSAAICGFTPSNLA
jgi:C1A family cysteine protease